MKSSYANLQIIFLMNKKQTHALAMLALVFGIAISPILAADNAEAGPPVSRYILNGEITEPRNDKPFGGDSIGTYGINVRDDFTTAIAILDFHPSEGMVFEGWLVDVETGEKLSTGTFLEGKRNNDKGMFFLGDIGFHYDVFVITEEPINDSDPTPTLPPVGAVPLSAPFGQ